MNDFQIAKHLQAFHLKMLRIVMARYKEMGIDLTPVQGNIILTIYHGDTTLCQTDIQNYMACNKSTLSSVLDTMEKNGLIKRKESNDDSRKKIILLTDLSKELVKQLERDKKDVEKLLCEGLSEEECMFFHNILKKMQDNLERMIK